MKDGQLAKMQQSLADREHVDRGAGGCRAALSQGETGVNLESGRRRPDDTEPAADEASPSQTTAAAGR